MTDENKHIIKLELPNFLDKALSPVANSIGNTLAVIWEGTFSGIESWAKSKKYQSEINLKKLMESLDKKFSEIPEENLQEPKMNILGPALESTKYFFEEEHYREMFSNLIAAAANKKLNSDIHPSFVKIIQQISPNDAFLLKKISEEQSKAIPIVQISSGFLNRKSVFMKNFTEFSENAISYNQYSLAIDNLVRLNLIYISYEEYFSDISKYEIFNHIPFIKFCKDNLTVIDQLIDKNNKVSLNHGICKLTHLGQSFIKICIN